MTVDWVTVERLEALVEDWRTTNPVRLQRDRYLAEFVDAYGRDLDLETLVPRSAYRALSRAHDCLEEEVYDLGLVVDRAADLLDALIVSVKTEAVKAADLIAVLDALRGKAS